jgi:hypothetical protein
MERRPDKDQIVLIVTLVMVTIGVVRKLNVLIAVTITKFRSV